MAENSKTVSIFDNNGFKEPSILIESYLFIVSTVYFLKVFSNRSLKLQAIIYNSN